MPTLNSIDLPPPQDWSEFEDLCCDLWRRIWQDPNAQKNGRRGQSQQGVDIFGYPQRGQTVEGVQCKLKSPWLGQSLTKSDIEEEVASAESFSPQLSWLTIATTSPRDARLQEAVRFLSAQRYQDGKFQVSVHFWDEIHSRLAEHEDLVRKHYPYLFVARLSVAEDPANQNDLDLYLHRLHSHFVESLPPLIPIRLLAGNEEVQLSQLEMEIVAGQVLHLQGPSGSGKSHLARHLAIKLVGRNYVPILTPAKYYKDDLSGFLNRSVRHLTTASADSLLSGSIGAGRTPILIIDGFNECPERSRAELVQDLQALLLRAPAKIIVTSRPEADSQLALGGGVYRLGYLNEEEMARFSAFLGIPAEGFTEILKTPLDFQIAAEVAAQIAIISPTQYDMFNFYVRRRLIQKHAAFNFLARLGFRMAADLSCALSESEYYRLFQEIAGGDPDIINVISDSGLLVFSQGYCSFWHEKVHRFLQAEALLLQSSSHESLAAQLRRPLNEDAVEFVLGALRDTSAIQVCLPAIRSRGTLLAICKRHFGSALSSVLNLSVREVFAKAHQELGGITVEVERELGFLKVRSSITWTEYEYHLMGFIGQAFVAGYYCREVLELLAATEQEVLRRLAAFQSRAGWSALLRSIYTFQSAGNLPAGHIFHGMRMGFERRWDLRARQELALRLEHLEQQSPGSLFLLAFFLGDVLWYPGEELSLLAKVPDFLRACLRTGVRSLLIEAAELAGTAGYRLDEPLRSEVESLLESFPRNDLLLSSAVIEALSQHRDLGLVSQETARSEIRQLLDGPRDERAYELAAALFDNQFEEVYQGHYYGAIEELQSKDRFEFHFMAVMGLKPDSFFLSAALRELIELAAPEALDAFGKWSSVPDQKFFISDDLSGVFLLAHIGLARTAETPPVLSASDVDEVSWQYWGYIIFWLHKSGATEADVRNACASYWEEFGRSLLNASVDPIFRMESYARGRQLSNNIYRPPEEMFREELKWLFERALPRFSDLTSLLGVDPDSVERRAVFMIEALGRLGDEASVLILQPFVDSGRMGRIAVKSIRAIRERAVPNMKAE